MAEIRTTRLPSGGDIPRLGLGTWHMGEDRRWHDEEVAALKLGLDLGVTLVDTAEMYGSGGAEEVVRDAIAGRRDEVFLVSKVMPSNASRQGTVRACEASLRRMGVERIELYLLHWRGRFPLAETVEALEGLVEAGKIGGWGVSNFDVDDMKELAGVPGGKNVQTDQVLYNLSARGIDYDLIPALGRAGVPVMAYSPVGQGDLATDGRLAALAGRIGATAAQLALAWTMRHPHVVAIPKAVKPQHVRENRAAADLVLDPDILKQLDALFPPPSRKHPLQMI
jgi:diketogulonate reductase-like aldo/keto reductase